ncbi:hypothetical protein D0W66_04975 [Escherichia coli]|uniref:hypothetical protein n=1 Tax=Enterobacteriaceae TaxID=543 RepID=UPI000277A08A|nr:MULTISPECIES: hypothetical protein [Enterobacteriaceae]EEW2195371.1 hypothetical protein [Escherichia coli]AFP71470.1 hypothetical protein ECENHK_18195 [Enterobacter kobei]AMG91789.1 hypothetical protein AL479_04505 [Citrobacter amalonaticus]EEY5685560.1 hypothetical protein [Escherichia coli]EFB3794128.1 hypothetical protein [Escherichia coli]
MKIEFPQDVADRLFELARTREHGSAHAIIRKALVNFLDTVECESVKGDFEDDRSSARISK